MLCCIGARESVPTYLTLIPIAAGIAIASGGEPLFNIIGFSACLLATSCRALKSVVQVGKQQAHSSSTTAVVLHSRYESWAAGCQDSPPPAQPHKHSSGSASGSRWLTPVRVAQLYMSCTGLAGRIGPSGLSGCQCRLAYCCLKLLAAFALIVVD